MKKTIRKSKLLGQQKYFTLQLHLINKNWFKKCVNPKKVSTKDKREHQEKASNKIALSEELFIQEIDVYNLFKIPISHRDCSKKLKIINNGTLWIYYNSKFKEASFLKTRLLDYYWIRLKSEHKLYWMLKLSYHFFSLFNYYRSSINNIPSLFFPEPSPPSAQYLSFLVC